MFKDEVINRIIINSGDVANSLTSQVVELAGPYALTIQFTDSPNGILDLQLSLDNLEWFTYASQTVDSARQWPYKDENNQHKYMRLVWTPDGGTGTLTIICRSFNY